MLTSSVPQIVVFTAHMADSKKAETRLDPLSGQIASGVPHIAASAWKQEALEVPFERLSVK